MRSLEVNKLEEYHLKGNVNVTQSDQAYGQ